MRTNIKIVIAFLFLSLLIIRPTSSYAYWHDHGYVGVHIGVWPGPYSGYPYSPYYADPYYADPYYADPYYSGYVVAPSSSYQPVVVNGVTYYVNNGVYYIYTQYGYQAVATPAGAAAVPVIQPATVTAVPASVDTDDSFTINIPNNKGGYTTVILKKSGNGFVGPQGEFYTEFPKVSQLQVIYGK
jgi:hypothetical protein